MIVKFKASPSAISVSAPAFGDFDGMRRTCVAYKKGKGGVYRCKTFKSAKQVGPHPKPCPAGMISRSPGLIHKNPCVGGRRVAKKKTAARRRKR